MLVSARDVAVPAPDAEARAAQATLRPWQWDIYQRIDGNITVGLLAEVVGIELEACGATIAQLTDLGLVQLRAVTLEEYRKGFELKRPPSVPAPVRASAPAADAPTNGVTAEPIVVAPTDEPVADRLDKLRARAEAQKAEAEKPAAPAAPAAAAPTPPPAPPPPAPPTTIQSAQELMRERMAKLKSKAAQAISEVKAPPAAPEPQPNSGVAETATAAAESVGRISFSLLAEPKPTEELSKDGIGFVMRPEGTAEAKTG